MGATGGSQKAPFLEVPAIDAQGDRDQQGPLPTFLIIGAMKCGTSALARYLKEHPDTYLSDPKGLHFFDYKYDKGLDWYRAYFSAGEGKATIGEATTTYMYVPEALERMARLLPDAKLIAILRNPVDRAYSHYWHQRSRRREKLSFAEALRAEPERISKNEHLSRGSERLRFSYADRGRYIHQLEDVARHYPRERIHVLIYEEFFSSIMDCYREVCRYLDIDETVQPRILGESFGFRTAIRSPRIERLTKRMKGPGRQLLRQLNTATANRPPMDPSIREQLLATFRPDNEKLADWLGRDLEAWSR